MTAQPPPPGRSDGHNPTMTASGSQGRGHRGALVAAGARTDVVEWLPTGVSAVDAAGDPSVVKIRTGPAGRRGTFAEAAALAAVSHPHIVAFRGLDDDGESLGVLLPRLTPLSASEWITRRGSIAPGEAVTLLVPLLRAVAHVARRRLDGRLIAGAGSGRRVDLTASIDLEHVLFDVRGAPVLVGVRASTAGSDGYPWHHAGGGVEAARRLILPVLAAVVSLEEARARSLRELLERREPECTIDEIVEEVFSVAEPLPLDDVLRPGPASAQRWASRPNETVESPFERDDARSIDRLVVRLRRGLSAVRPRVWLLTGILVVSTVAAAALLTKEPDGSRTSSARASEEPTGSTTQPSSSQPATTPTDTATPSGRATQAADSGEVEGILTGDDVDKATRTLLSLRAACLRALDRGCLTGVDQDGSPLLEQDSKATDDPDRLDDLPRDVTLGPAVNRLGGAALYAATGRDDEPASVLVTRTEAGWRLRSVARR